MPRRRSRGLGRLVLTRSLERATGLREEDVVEGWGVDLKLLHCEGFGVERTNDLGQARLVAVQPDRDAPRRGGRPRAEALEDRRDAIVLGGIAGNRLDRRTPDLGLELGGGAGRDDAAVVDDPQ